MAILSLMYPAFGNAEEVGGGAVGGNGNLEQAGVAAGPSPPLLAAQRHVPPIPSQRLLPQDQATSCKIWRLRIRLRLASQKIDR